MKQQTAVEWLWNLSQTKELQASDFEQALAMEKEQVQKMIDDALTNYEIGWADRKKQFSLYEHKETITSADTPVSKTFLESVPKQETLYTEYQVREAILKASLSDTDFLIDRCDEIIQSLKQPKP